MPITIIHKIYKALLVVEFTMPGLVIFFFGVAAWVVALVCFFVDLSLNAQLGLFLVSSVLLIIALRKYVKNIFIGDVQEEDGSQQMEGFKGEKARVTEAIKPPRSGRIEFRGTGWNAESDQEIEIGVTVEIIGKRNITLMVKPL